MIPRLFRWRDRVTGLARTHPFSLALIVMVLVVISGFARIEQTAHQSCVRSNAARHDQITLWNYIIVKTTTPNQTPQQRRVVADLRAQLDDIFAPRKCSW